MCPVSPSALQRITEMFQSVSRNAAASSPPSANKPSSCRLFAAPSLTPSTLLAEGGQIQGSEAEDLTTLLPSLACQPCRLWQSAGVETPWLLGRGEVHSLIHQALGSRGASPLEGRAQPSIGPQSPLIPRNPTSLRILQKEKLRLSQRQSHARRRNKSPPWPKRAWPFRGPASDHRLLVPTSTAPASPLAANWDF